jgi:hypothetical protein
VRPPAVSQCTNRQCTNRQCTNRASPVARNSSDCHRSCLLDIKMIAISRRTTLGSVAAYSVTAALRLGRPALATSNSVRPALAIPPEIRANAEGVIAFGAGASAAHFQSGRPTATYGYNGPFLGPALRLRRGQTVTIDFVNHLPEPTTVHWHGLIIPGDVDGGPHRPVVPGGGGDRACRSISRQRRCGSIRISIRAPPRRSSRASPVC